MGEIVEHETEIFGKAAAGTVNHCIQCGSCTASCPSGRRTALRTREIFQLAQLGLKERILSSEELWACTTCYTCQERCPRGVKTTDIIRALRNIAVKNGYMKKKHQLIAGYLIKTGHLVPIDEATRKLRLDLNLTEIPPTTHKFPKSLREFQTLTRKLGFDKLITSKKD